MIKWNPPRNPPGPAPANSKDSDEHIHPVSPESVLFAHIIVRLSFHLNAHIKWYAKVKLQPKNYCLFDVTQKEVFSAWCFILNEIFLF